MQKRIGELAWSALQFMGARMTRADFWIGAATGFLLSYPIRALL